MKAEQVIVTDEDRAKRPHHTDDAIKGFKYVEGLPSDVLHLAVRFSPNGGFDHRSDGFMAIYREFSPDTNPHWLSSCIGQTLYDRGEIDEKVIDRIME